MGKPKDRGWGVPYPTSARGRMLALVVPDAKWSGMYRVHHMGKITDMVNLTRAKDAAISIALAQLNSAKEAA